MHGCGAQHAAYWGRGDKVATKLWKTTTFAVSVREQAVSPYKQIISIFVFFSCGYKVYVTSYSRTRATTAVLEFFMIKLFLLDGGSFTFFVCVSGRRQSTRILSSLSRCGPRRVVSATRKFCTQCPYSRVFFSNIFRLNTSDRPMRGQATA